MAKSKLTVLMVAVLCMVFLSGHKVYQGFDFTTVQHKGGEERAKVCDREPDASRAGVEIERRNGDGGYYLDENNVLPGCGFSPWGKSHIIFHRTCEGGPLGACRTDFHVSAQKAAEIKQERNAVRD